MNIFQKYPWLALLLLNIVLVGLTWLLFAFGLAAGISEDYHPNAVARPLFPTIGVLFLISIILLIVSLLAWFRWRRVTGRVVGVVLVTFILVLGIAGSTTYFLTDANPETYILEHRGFTYEIPRVYNPAYNPSSRESKLLRIEVCDEKPSAPVYDENPYFGKRGFPCTRVMYVITPIERLLSVPAGLGWVGDGKWGFTLATSSQGLVLTEYDEAIAADNFLERENAIDKTVIQSVSAQSSNVSVEYDTVIYMEVVNDLVKWLTICRGHETCTSYEPLPDDPQYVIQTATENAFFEHTGTVENMVWKYKEESEDALSLFETFKVRSDSNLVTTEKSHSAGEAGNGALPNSSKQLESDTVNTQTYSLTVEGPAATDFRVLSNEFEIGRFSSDVQFNYGRAIPLLHENTPNTVLIITDSASTGIDFSINRGDAVVCDPPVGTLTCTFSASPAYTLSSYEESGALPKCADTEFLSAFFGDISPYHISQFQRYFHVNIADLTGETPIFIDQDDSCSQNADLKFTHEAVFEAVYSSRESLRIQFGSDRSVTLLFHASDIADYASAAVGDNPATTAHLLLSLNGDVQSINLSGGVRDLYLLLSETR